MSQGYRENNELNKEGKLDTPEKVSVRIMGGIWSMHTIILDSLVCMYSKPRYEKPLNQYFTGS